MLDYHERRAGEHERIHRIPERQDELRTPEAAPAAAFAGRSVLEIACGTGWWTPHGARDALLDNLPVAGAGAPVHRVDEAGDGWQRRRLDDGSEHEIVKNHPGRDELLAAAGPRARDAGWTAGRHFRLFAYTAA